MSEGSSFRRIVGTLMGATINYPRAPRPPVILNEPKVGASDDKTGLTIVEMSELATYNGERARGLIHTPEHQARMAQLQATFDQAMTEQEHNTGSAP